MSWNIVELRKRVQEKFGTAQAELLEPSLRSIADRQFFAHFHYTQALEILADHLDGVEPAERFMLEFGPPNVQAAEYRASKKRASAHIVACLQNMHSLSDTFSHTVYFALGLNRNHDTSLKDRDISMANVAAKIANQAALAGIAAQLARLRNHSAYVHVDAIVNQSKHRSLVRSVVNHSVASDAPKEWTVQLEGFVRNEKVYLLTPIQPFLRDEMLRQTQIIVDIGVNINQILPTL